MCQCDRFEPTEPSFGDAVQFRGSFVNGLPLFIGIITGGWLILAPVAALQHDLKRLLPGGPVQHLAYVPLVAFVVGFVRLSVRAVRLRTDVSPSGLVCHGLLRDRWLDWADVADVRVTHDQRHDPDLLKVVTTSGESVAVARFAGRCEAMAQRLRDCSPPSHPLRTEADMTPTSAGAREWPQADACSSAEGKDDVCG